MKYTIEYLGSNVKSFSEKTFCFVCGCFQGHQDELTK